MTTKIQTIVKNNLNVPNVEIEMRLGNIFNNHFDSNVGKETYDKIFRRLLKYDGWENVSKSNTTVYYSGNRRMIIDDDTDEQTYHIKTRVSNNNYKMQPCDVRISVSTEVPCEEFDDEMDACRARKRTSFVRKNLTIDMTEVCGDADDLDDEEEIQYQVELEIMDPKLLDTENKVTNLVHKINDVLKIAN